MTWWRMLSSLRVVLCGHVKTMTEMCSPTLLLKVSDSSAQSDLQLSIVKPKAK